MRGEANGVGRRGRGIKWTVNMAKILCTYNEKKETKIN